MICFRSATAFLRNFLAVGFIIPASLEQSVFTGLSPPPPPPLNPPPTHIHITEREGEGEGERESKRGGVFATAAVLLL